MGVGEVLRSSARDDAIDMQGGPPAGFSGAGGQLLIPSILKNGNAVSPERFGARQDALTSSDPSVL